MMLYLATPIDRSKEAAPRKVAYDIIDGLRRAHFLGIIFSPVLAFMINDPEIATQNDMESLIHINTEALLRSDFMLLDYSRGVETWGLPQEVLMAHEHKIPIFIHTSERYQELPFYLRARTYSTFVSPIYSTLVSGMLRTPKRVTK